MYMSNFVFKWNVGNVHVHVSYTAKCMFVHCSEQKLDRDSEFCFHLNAVSYILKTVQRWGAYHEEWNDDVPAVMSNNIFITTCSFLIKHSYPNGVYIVHERPFFRKMSLSTQTLLRVLYIIYVFCILFTFLLVWTSSIHVHVGPAVL